MDNERRRVKPEHAILFSGGAAGAEAAFGECAERHAIEEVNFTFSGHKIARTNGVRVPVPVKCGCAIVGPFPVPIPSHPSPFQ